MAKKKKSTRCTRKTKAGTRCKTKAPTGRKTCVSHGGPTKKKKKAKKKARKKAVRKKAKKKAPKKVVRKKTKKAKKKARVGGVRKTKARCRSLVASGTRCKCYCEPGGVYCLAHRKKAKVAAAKIRKNTNPSSINCPWGK